MFKRVLIANRGEVANRIISSCLDLGIETVAIYSEDDRSLHYLNRADQAYCIGKGPVSSSYKNMDAIIAVAKMANVDCIHPGYGFLADSFEFAKLCADNNITFIGPDAKQLEFIGNKSKLRELAKKSNINVVPCSSSVVNNVKDGLALAKELGYPSVEAYYQVVKRQSFGNLMALLLYNTGIPFSKGDIITVPAGMLMGIDRKNDGKKIIEKIKYKNMKKVQTAALGPKIPLIIVFSSSFSTLSER